MISLNMNPAELRSRRQTKSAFTLAELVVVLAVLGAWALIAKTALSQSQTSSGRVICVNNLRRLGQAWQMYADDYAGILMGNQSGTPVGFLNWVSGIEDYSTANQDNVNYAYLTNTSYAAMGLYVKTSSAFRCPADPSTVVRNGIQMARVRSYSMNSYLGQGATAWSSGYLVMTNGSQLGQPDRTMVLLDENPDSINDGSFVVDLAGAGASSRLIDFPAYYHLGGMNLVLADGHTEYWQWADLRTMPPLGTAILNVASPNNPDVARLQKVTSYRP